MFKSILRSLKTTFVFCYHRVIPKELVIEQFVNRAMYVTPETFDKHVRWMKTVGEIIDHEKMLEKASGPRFIITFDDGWKDTFIYAMPILQKYDAQAIVFVSTNSIDQQKLFWPEEVGMLIKQSCKSEDEIASILQQLTISAIELVDYRDRVNIDSNWSSEKSEYLLDRFVEYLKVLPAETRDDFVRLIHSALGVPQNVSPNLLLTWDEVSVMQRGKISFGSHTHTHPILDRLDEASIESELFTSKQILESRLQREVSLFSYPNGCFGSNYIQSSLRKYGYKYAFTLERSPVWLNTDPFIIPRCLVYEDIAASLKEYYGKLVLSSFATEGISRVKKIF